MAESAKTRRARIATAYQHLPVIGPSGGVDLRTSPTLLQPTRARTLVNFALSEPGALVVRPGYRAFSTTSLGSSRAQGARRVYLNTAIPSAASTAFTLVAWGGGVYNISDSGGWVSTTPQLSGLSTSEIDFVADRDLVAAFDGVSTAIFKSTNGSSWTRFGIAPGASPTLSTLSTGGLSSGEYEVSYTYKDRDLAYEGNGPTSGSTITLSASSGAINTVIPNSTNPAVDAVVVYARKVTSGETVLRKVSSQAQSGGANSTVIVTSTAWTTNDEIPTDHTLPPVLSFGCVWKNRWWARSGTVTNRLHFTQLFQPQSWPGTYYIDIPFERGDEIRALVPLGDTLLVIGTTKIFVILGQTSLDFEVKPTIASQDGAFGFRSAVAIENGVVHVAASGVWIFDGTSDRLLSFDLEPAWRDLVDNASAASLARVSVTYHQRQKELRIAVPRRYPSGTDGEWVLDLNRTRTTQQPAWTSTDRQIGGFIPWDGPEAAAGDRGRLFSYHTSEGRLFEEATGTTANSSNVRAEYEGPGLTMGAYLARWVDVRGEHEPQAGLASLEAVVDGVSMGSQAIPMSATGAVYGTATYGTSVYAGGQNRKQWVKMLPLTASGRTFVLKYVYLGQNAYKLFSYNVGLVPETASRDFSE
jgi:hypothetical protein